MLRTLIRGGYLNPILLQVLGILLLIGFVAFWLVTGKESVLFVGATLTLIGVGSAGGALVTVRQEIAHRAGVHLDQVHEADMGENGGEGVRAR